MEVVAVRNGAYRSFKETLISALRHVVSAFMAVLNACIVDLLFIQVPDKETAGKVLVKVSGDGARFSSSSSFVLLSFSLPGSEENVLSSAGIGYLFVRT